MISLQIQDIRRAEADIVEGSSWVVLRFADASRVVIHTRNFTQAVAIADAINGEIDQPLRPEAAPVCDGADDRPAFSCPREQST